MDADNEKDPVLQPPTNVTRICRSISRVDTNGNNQIAYYQSGIGTDDIYDSIVGGATGMGLGEHIREAYHFLAQNYDQKAADEIYLVGFSRGSFTARSIAAFIDAVGLLTQKGMLYFYPIFQDWENQLKPLKDWKPNPNYPWQGQRPNLYSNAAEYTNELFKRGMTRKDVRIKAVACYDTVGSLGIPRIGIFSSGVPPEISLDYAFVDTTVPDKVEHAIHALALDEMRKPFSPTIWELPNPKEGQTLTQVWFQGAHADVGGGYDDLRPGDITLAWMVSQLSPYLTFDLEVLKLQLHDPTVPAAKDPRSWGLGQIHDEFKGKMKLGGWLYRTPMEYHPYDHNTGKEITSRKLVNTCEKVHSSVRIRMGVPGLGLEDKGTYNPPALEGWKLSGTSAPAPGRPPLSLQQILEGQKSIVWKKDDLVMQEEPLSQLELDLLNQYVPKLEPDFLSIKPKEHKLTSAFRGLEKDVQKWLPNI
ncbi:hypothetical protein, variant [Verruconis gallopava]|nr:hypothetical protein, variant [Verruconis gallopava]KIW08406.1 hypothetical protein, variant [Verruconis gallopava]